MMFICQCHERPQDHMQVTTDILISTQAGKKIKKLTKHSNTAVSQAAAATVAAWKSAVTQEVGAQNGAAAGDALTHVALMRTTHMHLMPRGH